jgi:glycosyltransferase involved in cell wall biosynthesis
VRPPLSVVIPTKDRADKLDRCLAVVCAALDTSDEVLVVDSASSDDSTRQVASRHGVGYLRAERPGTSLARNLGWRAARHELIAFIDDDILVTPGWPDSLAAAFADPDVSFIAGRIELPPDHDEATPAVSLLPDTEPRVLDRETRGLLGISANTGVRRDALRAINGFDTRLGPATWFGGGEDNDFFDRLVHAGFVGRYDPDVVVQHVQWRTGNAFLAVQWSYGKGMGARFAKALMRDGRGALVMLPEVTRLGGVRTAVSDVRTRSGRSWGPPLAWRFGVVAGFLVGLVKLRGEHTA